MIPENTIASPPHVSGFSYPVKQPGDLLVDWELAGIALNDPSQGLAVKLWKLQVVPNEVSGLQDVTVSAPGVVPTVLFSGAGITEVALAFDQNMNPFVAYTQSGAPKIYWYDSTIPGMTTTVLPAGCYDLRACLDEKREFDVANSDIVLSYIRAGNLCVRYQRDRYATEYVLKSGIGAGARLVSAAMNLGSRLQWRVRGYTLSDPSGALVQAEPYLGDIVFDLCYKSGIPQNNIDVSDLYRDSDIVPGMKVAIDEGLNKPIEWLAEMYRFDKTQHGKKLRFEHRGKEISFRIPYSDLVVNGNREVFGQEKVDGKGLPRDVYVNHIDSTAGFARNKQTASRRSNLLTNDEQLKIEAQVVQTPEQAATAALTILKARWGEQYKYKFSTTLRYTSIVPSDVGEVQSSDGEWHRLRITERNEDSGVIDFEAIQDAGKTVYIDTLTQGITLPTPVSTTPGIIGPTTLEVLNIPVQRDQEDELGLYIAALGTSSGWNGYTLLVSFDGGATYSSALTSDAPANVGELATSLAPGGTSVEVLVPYTLESVTSAAIGAGQNRAIIGQEEVQYQTAALIGMSGDLYHYGLSGIVRGIMGTDEANWPAGTRFVELDSAVQFLQIQRAYYDNDVYYKAVSLGASADDVTASVYHLKPMVNQTELAVTGLTATAVGSAVKVDWVNNPRLGTFGTPFNSRYFAGYRVKFSDGYSVDTTNTTLTYATPPPGGTVQVCQLNQITGEGPFVSVAIPAIGFRVTEAGDKRITETGDYRITE